MLKNCSLIYKMSETFDAEVLKTSTNSPIERHAANRTVTASLEGMMESGQRLTALHSAFHHQRNGLPALVNVLSATSPATPPLAVGKGTVRVPLGLDSLFELLSRLVPWRPLSMLVADEY